MFKNRMYSAVFALSLLACVGGQAFGMEGTKGLEAFSFDGKFRVTIEDNRLKVFRKDESGNEYLFAQRKDVPCKDDAGGLFGTPVSLAVNGYKAAIGYQASPNGGAIIEFRYEEKVGKDYYCLPSIKNFIRLTNFVPFVPVGIVYDENSYDAPLYIALKTRPSILLSTSNS